MNQFERGQEDLKKRAPGEQNIMEHKKALLGSGLLERIEKRRLELKNEGTHKFGLYPRPTYRGSMDSDHFLKELSFLHTQYSVDLSGWYSSFCIEVKADGIYWVKSGKQTKKINPGNITDHDIADWFWSLSKQATHGGKG
jgi:hypothetical protein